MIITHRRRKEERQRSGEFSVHELNDEDSNDDNEHNYDLEANGVKCCPDLNGEFASDDEEKETNNKLVMYATSKFTDEVSLPSEETETDRRNNNYATDQFCDEVSFVSNITAK